MRIFTFSIAIALLGPLAAFAASITRHDGTVEAVDPKAQTLVIWEPGWSNAICLSVKGPG